MNDWLSGSEEPIAEGRGDPPLARGHSVIAETSACGKLGLAMGKGDHTASLVLREGRDSDCKHYEIG
jgi:hypothetical protein